jgi:hypothetical protein
MQPSHRNTSSKRTRNEPPEIIPIKSDEEKVEDEEINDGEAESAAGKSETSETSKATRSLGRARKPTKEQLNDVVARYTDQIAELEPKLDEHSVARSTRSRL